MIEFTNISNKFRTAQFFRERLISDPAVYDLVGENIYPLSAPETKGPYIVISRVAYDVQSTKTGIYSRRCNVLLEIFSDDYDKGLDIATAVDDLFCTLEDERPNILGLIEATEVLIDGKFVQVLEYIVE